MRDPKLSLRTAYYQLLNGALTYNAVTIPVSDDLLNLASSSALQYVILSTQSSQDTSTFSSFDTREDIIIDIVSKAQSRLSKTVVDSIASQIMNLVLPNPGQNGLPSQANFVFQNVQKIADRYIDLQLNSSTTVVRRLLTFTQTVRQTS